MEIHFQCKNCQTKYVAQAEQSGKEGMCKICGKKIVVPKLKKNQILNKQKLTTEHYDAFISYSRLDRAFAEKLEKALENYKPAKDLNLPQRHLNIFRDEGDMTGTEYFDSIEAHLERSAKLIVVCSANARRSELVDDEIRRFLKFNTAKKIIPILLSGIPNNEAASIHENEKAFPPSLSKALEMPLATDFRSFGKSGTNVRAGALKAAWYMLLANIYSVSRDEIEQREKKRQRGRRRTIADIISAVMIFLSIAGIYAVFREREAKIQLAFNYWKSGKEARDEQKGLRSLHYLSHALQASQNVSIRNAIATDIEPAYPEFSLYHVFSCEGPISGASFSRDEKHILTWSEDGTARLWQAETGKQIGISFEHDDVVNGARFSHDEMHILTWSKDGTARVWVVSTGRQIGPSLKHDGPALGAQFSRDEQRILTWSEDGSARLWSSETGKQVGQSLKHEGPVLGAQFSLGEYRILTWSGDGSAILWSSETGKQVVPSLKHEGPVLGAQFSPDGQRILTWSEDGSARLWSSETGKQIGGNLEHEDVVNGARFSHDGTRILTWSRDKTAALWFVENLKRVRRDIRHNGPVLGASFSRDDAQILTWGKDHVVMLSPAEIGITTNIAPFSSNNNVIINDFSHRNVVLGAIFSPDEKRILSWCKSGTAHVWEAIWVADARDEPIRPSLMGIIHGNAVNGARFSQDGTRILSWSDDGTARLWQAETRAQESLIFDSSIDAAMLLPDEKLVLTFGMGAPIRTWNAETGQQIGAPIGGDDDLLLDVQLSQDGTRILTTNMFGELQLWDSKTSKQIKTFSEYKIGEVHGATFSRDDTLILIWDSDGVLKVFRADTGEQIRAVFKYHGAVLGATFSHDETRLLAWGDDGNTMLWDVESAQQLDISFGHDDAVNGAIFSRDDTHLLTWSDDATARLWDVETGDQLGTSFEHDDVVNGAIFYHDETRILTWSGDGTSRLWDIETREQLGPSFDGARPIFLQDETRILTLADEWGLWHVESGQQIASFKHTGSIYEIGPSISHDEMSILTLSYDGVVRLSPMPGDLDMPAEMYVLQTEALTGTRLNPKQGNIVVIPVQTLKHLQGEYSKLARAHAKKCKYPRQNVYLRFWREKQNVYTNKH